MSITIEAQATRTLIQQDGVSRVAFNDDGSMELLTPPSVPSGNMVTTFNQFGSSLSGSGYQKLPSGLIIQWGKNTVSNDSSLNVTLPVAFSVSGFSATTAFAQAGDYNDSCGAFFSSTSILVLTNASNVARAVHWMAIGQ